MSSSEPGDRYASLHLTGWVAEVFAACSVPDKHAWLTADALVRTSLRGIDTHGIARIQPYVQRLRHGEFNAVASPTLAWRYGLLLVDGDGALGPVVATFALRAATARARETALVGCTIRHCTHLGALGTCLLEAAEQGFIALLCQNTPPVMAQPGSTARAIGNNPIAFAAPVRNRVPLVFDMANSVVARGEVAAAHRMGQPIPADWAIAPDGSPTTDPQQALAGAMLPMAGHKGIGMAMVVECLAGCLAGAARGDTAASDAGAFLLVINPDLAIGRAEFDAHMDAWISAYHRASGADSRYPGQRQAQCEQERREFGIPIDAPLLETLRGVGNAVGRPFDLDPLNRISN